MVYLSFQHIGGPFADRGVQFRRIPGTELAQSGNPASKSAISVSPDERWATYWEENTEWADGGAPTSTWQLCSVDLVDETRIVHRVDSLAVNATVPWADVAWGFDPGGWSGSRLFIEGIDLLAVIDPTRQQVEQLRMLPPQRTGLDAPRDAVIDGALRRRNMPTENFEMERHSFVWSQDGKPYDLYYAQYIRRDVYAIMHHDGQSSREVLRREGPLKLYSIDQVRVSPDQTFLAYSSFVNAKGHTMLPDYGTSLFVRHLPSGTERRVGRHLRVSNLIWSADSNRLYYAGSGFERFGSDHTPTRRGAGVFCIDVAASFPATEFARVPPRPPDPTPAELRASRTKDWKRYVDASGFALRYPHDSMTLTSHGDVTVLSHNRRQSNRECTANRPEGFYAQVQVVGRDIDEVIEELRPEFRDGRWDPRYGPAETQTVTIGSVQGARIRNPAGCDYLYVLYLAYGQSLVWTRVPRPGFEKERLFETEPEFKDSTLPWTEDPTFAYILSTIELEARDESKR
jgi:hypothetical protein